MLEINKIHLGDCLELMKDIPDKSIDLVLTDPPYLMNNHGGQDQADKEFSRKLTTKKHIDFICNDFDWENTFNEFIRICKKVNLIIFCSNAQISRTMKFFEDKNYSVNLLIWDKPNPIPLCNGKLISNLEYIIFVKEKGAYFNNLLSSNEKLKTYKYPAPRDRIHPTEKPIKLFEHILRLLSKTDDLILDCFSGSGTTAVACHNLKRRFICIEKDYDYWKASCERLEREQAQLKLF